MVPNMKEIISMVKRMDSVIFSGQINLLIAEILLIIIFMEMEDTGGRMEGNTVAIGFVTKCMAKVFLHGLMAENTKVNTMMIRNKGTEFSHGPMVGSMTDIG